VTDLNKLKAGHPLQNCRNSNTLISVSVMPEDASDFVAELRTLLTLHRGEGNQVLVVLIARTLVLAEMVQEQREKIADLENRIQLMEILRPPDSNATQEVVHGHNRET
jgi:hypothetical protein